MAFNYSNFLYQLPLFFSLFSAQL